MPMRGEIQVSVARPCSRESRVDKVWAWIVAAIENPEFLMIILFCTVGLWLTFYFIQFFPDYGAMAASLEAFP